MRQILASIGFGVLLLALWVGIIVLTSTDFQHEGPDSAWVAPISLWADAVRWSGIPRLFDLVSPAVELAASLFIITAPFIALFSAISFNVLRFLARRQAEKSLA